MPLVSSGIATQTILTIPVSHVTNNQMVNLALSNGQVVSTTLANLQSLAQPQNMLNTPTSNGKFSVNQFTRIINKRTSQLAPFFAPVADTTFAFLAVEITMSPAVYFFLRFKHDSLLPECCRRARPSAQRGRRDLFLIVSGD